MLVRYADDFVIVFEQEDDARRVFTVLPKRFGKYGLALHPTKTRMVRFHRPPPGPLSGQAKPETFDLLGFTHFWTRSWRGHWVGNLPGLPDSSCLPVQFSVSACLENQLRAKASRLAVASALRGKVNRSGEVMLAPSVSGHHRGRMATCSVGPSRSSKKKLGVLIDRPSART